ncbi:hypothetical protein ACQPW1_09420 [Nocardia sp. CA-128927]|uniref:hypothetical protein n=1 Tax=Nocardia sp. CA-128927 TaxID=3239975 RepID=UPI003D99DBD8
MSERLERNRERVEKRRARARQREKAITAAVKRYVAVWVAIDECESKRDRDLESYRQQMQQLKIGAEEELAGYRGEQAAAAVALREEGQSDDDVAELLEITPRQARQLISAARSAAHESGPSGGSGKATPEVKSPEPHERRPICPIKQRHRADARKVSNSLNQNQETSA